MVKIKWAQHLSRYSNAVMPMVLTQVEKFEASRRLSAAQADVNGL
jgi:hypothetical protein